MHYSNQKSFDNASFNSDRDHATAVQRQSVARRVAKRSIVGRLFIASFALLSIAVVGQSCEAQLFRRGRMVRSNYTNNFQANQFSNNNFANSASAAQFGSRFGSGIPYGYRGYGLPASVPAPVQTFVANPAPISNLGGNGFQFTRGYRSTAQPMQSYSGRQFLQSVPGSIYLQPNLDPAQASPILW